MGKATKTGVRGYGDTSFPEAGRNSEALDLHWPRHGKTVDDGKKLCLRGAHEKGDPEIGGYIRKVEPEDTAAILFTSGTTAMPKGVMLSHYSLVNSALEICSHMGWEESDKMMIAVPLFHCFGLTASLLTSIHTGCCMHTVEYYKTMTVLETVQKYHCTVLNGVPSMFLAITRNPAHRTMT